MNFVQLIIDGRNKERKESLSEEIDLLQDLPSCKYNAPLLTLVRVSRSSTVRIQNGVYSVPSRLIRHQLKACVYPAYIELYYGMRLVQTMPKLSPSQDHAINYRHIISQLVRKPGAFKDYKYRECLFPRLVFLKAYESYCKSFPHRGHKIYLKVLHLAALSGESKVANLLEKGFKSGKCPSFEEIETQLNVIKKDCPDVRVDPPQLKLYDRLMPTFCPKVYA